MPSVASFRTEWLGWSQERRDRFLASLTTPQLEWLLRAGGVPHPQAPGLPALVLASCEGAVVMARAERDLGPFDTVAETLLTYVDQLA